MPILNPDCLSSCLELSVNVTFIRLCRQLLSIVLYMIAESVNACTEDPCPYTCIPLNEGYTCLCSNNVNTSNCVNRTSTISTDTSTATSTDASAATSTDTSTAASTHSGKTLHWTFSLSNVSLVALSFLYKICSVNCQSYIHFYVYFQTKFETFKIFDMMNVTHTNERMFLLVFMKKTRV